MQIGKALAAPEVKDKLNAAGGLDPYATTPEGFAALVRRDYEKYGKLVRDIGVKVD